jgi:predicted DNA binding protein
MSVLVEATVPAEQFALPETNREVEEVEFRAVRLVAHESGRIMPFLWAHCDDPDRLYETVGDDPSVANVDVLAEFDGECLLRIDWESPVSVFLSVLRAEGAVILGLSGCDGRWHFRIFLSDDALVSANEICDEYSIDISIRRVNELPETSEYGCFGLTERQYETIVCAYESGYYDVPRKINQEELADRFGISHQALSERLRRAHETVITNTLSRRIHRRDRSVLPQVRTESTPQRIRTTLR